MLDMRFETKAQETAALKKTVKKYNKQIDEAIERIRKGKYFTKKQADAILKASGF